MSKRPIQSRLMTMMFTDVVSSVAMKSTLGIADYGQAISRHDELLRDAAKSSNGTVLKDTGDGFMVGFSSTSQAVEAALRFQRAVAGERWPMQPLRVRIGVHAGEVSELDRDVDGKPKLVGLAPDLAARLMSLALPGQILLSRAVFDDARQYIRIHPSVATFAGSSAAGELRWIAHGRYLVHGSDDPLEVFEVGAPGEAPLQAPPDSEKARRATSAVDEPTLGWRPAAGLEIPKRDNWILDKRLGEGGFGEVWLARHAKTGQHRVFKFCFDADKLRSFRRELTLFRLLREALGDRPDIAQLYDIQLDEPPFFIESEFTEAGNLTDWASALGGIQKVALQARIDLAARTADALAAAHSIGVLHKDIKPSNILIYGSADDPRPRISDFGIGALADRRQAQKLDVTIAGFTETLVESASSGATGTRMYVPPESLAGKPFTTQSDVYSLGVVLYQLVVGDLQRPLAQGWERGITDPLLREDIAKAVAGDPKDRFSGAAELAASLRALPKRRAARRRGQVVRIGVAAIVGLAMLMGLMAIMWGRERGLRREAETAKADALNQKALADAERAKAEQSAKDAQATLVFLQDMISSVNPVIGAGPQVTMKQVLDSAAGKVNSALPDRPVVQAAIRNTLGEAYTVVDSYEQAMEQLNIAVDLRTQALGAEHPDTLTSRDNLAALQLALGHIDEADATISQTLEARTRVLGPDAGETLATKSRLALVRQDQQRFDESERIHREVIEAKTRALGPEHRETLESTISLADLLEDLGRLDEAEAMMRKNIEIADRAYGTNDPLAIASRSVLASTLEDLGRYEESEATARQVVEAKTKLYGDDHAETLVSKNVLALTLEKLKRYDESSAMLREVWTDAVRVLGPTHGSTLAYQDNLARQEQLLGNLDEAERLMRESLDIQIREFGEQRQGTLVAMNNLALLLLDRKKPAEALPLFEKMNTGLAALLPPGHWMLAAARKNLGEAQFDLAQYDAAETSFLAAYEGLKSSLGEDHDRTRGGAKSLVDLYTKWNKPEKAAEWRGRAGAPAESQPASQPK